MSDTEVSGDYNIANSRPQFEVGGWIVDGIRVHNPGSVTFNTERSCVNCTYEHQCWGDGNRNPLTPPNFRLRASWEAVHLDPYMKRIFGGICAVFTSHIPEVNIRMQATERERLNKKEPQEWEE